MQNLSLLNIYSIIIKLIILAGIGFFLYRKEVLKEDAVNFLTDFLIKVCVPCLIFTNLIENFVFGQSLSVWIFIILSLAIFLTGVLLAILLVSLTKEKDFSKEIITLIAFQNCGYLPMNIVYFLFSSPQKDKLLNFIFLYILGFNILMWSVGSFFIFRKRKERFRLNSLLNLPVLAIIIALFIKKAFPAVLIPDVIFSPMKMLGELSFALSMIVLGAGLSKVGFLNITKKIIFNIVSISVFKLILIPLLFIIFIAKFKISGLLGFFIILQASMPSAVSLPIITKWKKANYEFSSQAVFFTHLFSLLTVPFWINIFLRIKF